MKTISTIILLLIASLAFSSDVEIRFANQEYNMERMYVDIEVRSKSGSFNLGSQNLRAYYNTNAILLNEGLSSSKLSTEIYNELNVVSKFENVNADEVNQLTFDADMGFINFNIELKNIVDGGINISGEWVTLATLAFDIQEKNEIVNLVWAREDRSDAYATAFVEIAEWLAPNKISTKEITEFNDLEDEIEFSTDNELTLEIGPNPTSDFVNIIQNKSNTLLTIIDMSGRVIEERNLTSSKERIDIQSYQSGNYIFNIFDGENNITKKLMKLN